MSKKYYNEELVIGEKYLADFPESSGEFVYMGTNPAQEHHIIIVNEHGTPQSWEEDRLRQYITHHIKKRHKRKIWLNVYNDLTQDCWGLTKEEANQDDADNQLYRIRIACIPVEYEFFEGEGLEQHPTGADE